MIKKKNTLEAFLYQDKKGALTLIGSLEVDTPNDSESLLGNQES